MLHHPRLSSFTAPLAALCRALSQYPLHQSYMLFLTRYLATYSTGKLQTSLFGASNDSAQRKDQGGVCSYLGRLAG